MKYALRVLGREKAFTAFAILTLALGIGAVTSIFSVVDGVLLKPLACGDPGRLYAASEPAPKLAQTYQDFPSMQPTFTRGCRSAAPASPARFFRPRLSI